MKAERKSLIFSLLAMGGVAVTSILAVNRSPKYKEILEETGSKPKAFFKAYWPALLAGVATDVAIGVSQRIGAKEIAAIGGVATYAIKNRDNIQKKITEYTKESGGDVLKDLTKEVNKEYVIENIPTKTAGPCVEETGRGDLLCFEGYSGRWFRSSETAVSAALTRFKQRWESGEYLNLNDLYAELGISSTHFGNEYGWANNADYYDCNIDISTDIVEGWDGGVKNGRIINEEVLIIEIWTYPMEGWMEV